MGIEGPNAPKGTKSSVTIPKAGNMRGSVGGGGVPVSVFHISGNEIINDRNLSYKINQAGSKRGRHFR
jgi:hypothetical protein